MIVHSPAYNAMCQTNASNQVAYNWICYNLKHEDEMCAFTITKPRLC